MTKPVLGIMYCEICGVGFPYYCKRKPICAKCQADIINKKWNAIRQGGKSENRKKLNGIMSIQFIGRVDDLPLELAWEYDAMRGQIMTSASLLDDLRQHEHYWDGAVIQAGTLQFVIQNDKLVERNENGK